MSVWSRLVLFVTLAVCSLAVRGAPVSPNLLAERQVVNGKLVGPMTFNQVTTDVSSSGTRVETCVVTLTPQSDGTVLEDRKCTTKFTPNVSNNGTGSASGTDSNASQNGTTTTITRGTPQASATGTVASSTSTTSASSSSSIFDNTKGIGAAPDVATASASSTTSSTPAVVVLPSASVSVTASSPVQTTASNATATPTKAPAISVIGTTSVSASNALSTPTASPGTVATDRTGSTSAAGEVSGQVTSASSSSAPATAGQDNASSTSSSASATLAAASTSPSSIQLPGTKLSVLPIGLGVFGGISAIALIVVGYVMYERTKYRKNFRARQKLSEQGANPGYGGMSQRV